MARLIRVLSSQVTEMKERLMCCEVFDWLDDANGVAWTYTPRACPSAPVPSKEANIGKTRPPILSRNATPLLRERQFTPPSTFLSAGEPLSVLVRGGACLPRGCSCSLPFCSLYGAYKPVRNSPPLAAMNVM